MRAHALEESQVAGAAKNVIGDAGDHELGPVDPRVPQRVDVGDVAVDALDAPAAQLAHDRRVEVDDKDLADEVARLLDVALMLELIEDRARIPEKTEEDHWILLLVVVIARAGRSVEVLQPDRLE